ncbi:NucA/NucB deoxyribonuclease domain-containing protein [Lentzea sp. NPDC004782]|uniref:NucA/NucB deoxyribonuclease domain-containing protein n=1 Tax=Lentzea sp. NPDC004782 TaxID=3154458 RepID=UPI0033AFE165
MSKRYLRAAALAAAILSALGTPGIAQAGPRASDMPDRVAVKPDANARAALEAAARSTDQSPQRIGGSSMRAAGKCDPLSQAHGSETVICVTPLQSGARPTKAEVSQQTIQPLPDWCYDHAFDDWWATRTQMCMIDAWTVTVTRTVNGVVTPIGGFDYNGYNYSYTSADMSTWASQTEIGMYNPWGDIAGIQVSGASSCTGACINGGADFPSQPVVPGAFPGGEAFFTSTATTRGSEGRASTTLTYYFTKPGATPSTPHDVPTPDVRCDHKLPGNNTVAGCIVYGIAPVMTYSLTTPYPELAAHIRDAQATGIPGSPFGGSPLHRLIDPTLQQRNRDVACPDSLPRPPGKSCDEYPMASTWEGAATGVNNYSWRMIDEAQNSNGGNAMNTFYRNMRLLDWDAFYVGIVP